MKKSFITSGPGCNIFMQESTLSYQCWRERESNVEHGMRFAKDGHCIIQGCGRPVTSTDKKLLKDAIKMLLLEHEHACFPIVSN